MSEPIKLSDVEMSTLREIQSKYEEQIFKFGQLYLDKVNLQEKLKLIDTTEETLKSELDSILKNERDWVNQISNKYGDGNLSLKDGTFSPTKI